MIDKSKGGDAKSIKAIEIIIVPIVSRSLYPSIKFLIRKPRKSKENKMPAKKIKIFSFLGLSSVIFLNINSNVPGLGVVGFGGPCALANQSRLARVTSRTYSFSNK